ncbi:unnamed protein product [Cyclocybe aegerita]|uniref:Uncharacterized protein n=1 Tax=Cyclocybe aegerita TaxID=1973307 RepID=A0A8S0XPW3_CYCAE|nr:unnamed protein product [Cyclocybe aegerita]
MANTRLINALLQVHYKRAYFLSAFRAQFWKPGAQEIYSPRTFFDMKPGIDKDVEQFIVRPIQRAYPASAVLRTALAQVNLKPLRKMYTQTITSVAQKIASDATFEKSFAPPAASALDDKLLQNIFPDAPLQEQSHANCNEKLMAALIPQMNIPRFNCLEDARRRCSILSGWFDLVYPRKPGSRYGICALSAVSQFICVCYSLHRHDMNTLWAKIDVIQQSTRELGVRGAGRGRRDGDGQEDQCQQGSTRYFVMSSELRYTANTQLEHLHARYTGTGHADLSKYEWLTHQHRDTLSSIVGHPTLASYLAIADGEAIGRIKFEMTERMLQPCGPPPKKDDD